MGLIKSYKQTALTSRLIAFFVAATFVGIVAWYYQFNVSIVVGAIAGIALVAEAVFFHPRFTLVSIITLAQIVVVSVTSMIMLTVIEQFVDFENGLFISTGMQAVGLAAILISLVGNYWFSQGRLWINVLISSLIYDAIVISLVVSGIDLSYVISALIGTASIIVYIILRHFISIRKKTPFDLNTIKTSKSSTVFKGKFLKTHQGFKALTNTYHEKVFAFHDDKTIFVTAPFYPDNYLQLIKNDIWVDKQVITPVLELLIENSEYLSKELKIDKKYFVPVLYSPKNDFNKDVTTLKVRNKKFPDRLLGKVYVVNRAGLEKLINQYALSKNKLPEKLLN